MKLKVKKLHDDKVKISFELYASDKKALETQCEKLGWSTTDALRTFVNNVVDGTIKLEG